jgi:hypothetical protein
MAHVNASIKTRDGLTRDEHQADVGNSAEFAKYAHDILRCLEQISDANGLTALAKIIGLSYAASHYLGNASRRWSPTGWESSLDEARSDEFRGYPSNRDNSHQKIRSVVERYREQTPIPTRAQFAGYSAELLRHLASIARVYDLQELSRLVEKAMQEAMKYR